LRRGLCLLRGEARRPLRRLRGDGARGVRRSRTRDRGRAAGGVQVGPDRRRRRERRAPGRARARPRARLPMARVTEVTPETATGKVAEIFADSLRQFGNISNFSKVMANAPAALEAWMTANRGVRMKYLKAGDLDFLRLEQLVIVKTASLNGGRYCLGHNQDLGLEAGLTPEQVA